jgi:hypothetical protein
MLHPALRVAAIDEQLALCEAELCLLGKGGGEWVGADGSSQDRDVFNQPGVALAAIMKLKQEVDQEN